MASRIDLQVKLEELLCSRNVYYQPPDNLKMNYPAIRYSKKKPDIKHADDSKYLKFRCYELIVISKSPDDPVIEKLEELDFCEWDNHYVADNLNHDVLTIYF